MKNKHVITYFTFTVLFSLMIFIFAFGWMFLRKFVGKPYAAIRNIESFTLFEHFSGWYDYFMFPAKGTIYNFYSIYISSIPFGMFFASLIFLLGIYASNKIRSKHINAHIKHNNNNFSHKTLMKKMAVIHPHNYFYNHFDLASYSMNEGVASMPLKSIEFLKLASERFAENIENEYVDYIDVPKSEIEEALKKSFGKKNPFLNLKLHQRKEITSAVRSLEWYETVILYCALKRLYCFQTGEGAETVINDTQKTFDDIWRTIYFDVVKKNKIKPNELEKVAPALKDYYSSNPKDLTKIRIELLNILRPCKAEVPQNIILAHKELMESIISNHGFMSGVLASAILETRNTGVFQDALFNWLRYDVDKPLWRFIAYIGMQVTVPESVGVYDHWNYERHTTAAMTEPTISQDAIESIIYEANKYTPATIRLDNDK